ncbi:MAG: NAD(P)H-dependent glycerol-3-phosphate dehydrogenase [Candidatus Neomarinimicrobiota bacterium]
MDTMKVTVLGCGTWGSTLTKTLSGNGHKVTAWHHDPKKVDTMSATYKHPHLAGFEFPRVVSFEPDLSKSLRSADFAVIAVPSHVVRSVMTSARDSLLKETIIVNVAKGIENDTLLTMSKVIQETTNHGLDKIVSLYGPSHAEEVIKFQPTTLVSASYSLYSAERVQTLFSSRNLRVYTNSDIMGVEIGGSLKNIIAIAAGICDGINYGDNTKAALLTRGIAEISRLGLAMGARAETFSGLSGIGDLIATCLSRYSRNRFVGESIGQGKKLKEVLDEMDMVAEGIKTAQSVHDLKLKYAVEMPISDAVYKILFHDLNPREAVVNLMTRSLIKEGLN